MRMKHLLIEGYCDGEKGQQEYPCRGTYQFGVHCFDCPKFSYAPCPDEIAISNSEGIVEKLEDFVGFGGDMEPQDITKTEQYLAIWKQICAKKINEAYEIYMNIMQNNQKKEKD